jgi:hypothetical protein
LESGIVDDGLLITEGMYAGQRMDPNKVLPPIPKRLEDAKTVEELELFYMEQARLQLLEQNR